MKKLFFAALVAVAAVGGAHAVTVFPVGQTGSYTCDGEQAACNLKYSLPANTQVTDIAYTGEGSQDGRPITELDIYSYDL